MKNLFTYTNSLAGSLKRYSKFLLLAVMFLAFNTQAWAGFYLWGYDTYSPQKGNGNATVVAQEMIPTDNTNTTYRISLDGRKSSDYCFFISTTDSKDFTTAYNQRLTINKFTGNSYLNLGHYGNFDQIYHVYSNNNLVITISYLTPTATLDATSTEPTPYPSGTTPVIRIGKQPVVINDKDVDLNFQLADWGCAVVTTVKVYYTTDGSVPTTSSSVKEFTDLAYNSNTNFTLKWENVPSYNYNIKAVACNSKGCGEELSDMASFTITACEKPAQPKNTNVNRTACASITLGYGITAGNDVLVIVNEGTESTAVAPQDGQAYTAAVAPEGITITKNTDGAGSTVTITGLDGHKQYTVTCYQYVPATKCYSEPATYVIEKGAPEIEVAVTDIARSTAIANINVKNTLGDLEYLILTWYLNGVAQLSSRNLKDAPDSDGNISYTITNLFEDKTYQLEVYAKNNYGCETTTERVEFTTKTCPKLTQYNVTGVNTIGKVQATITMAGSQTDAEYQLYIGDTPIDGTLQDGTGNALTWQVNQTGLYYVKGWFKEALYDCTNAPTIMGEYNLDCVQAATPVISIDKNVICSNDVAGATISVTEVANVTYKLYKDGEQQNNTLTDGKFTGITQAGNYTVVATENKCQTTATSQIVTLTVIDASASVTINPTTDTTTPWVPVNFTVTSTAGAPYTLVYKDAAGNDVTDQMVVVKKGNSYSLKIPRPEAWGKGNSTNPVATTTYTVEASLEGQASCGSTSTLTITLNDTFEICE